MNSFGKMMGVAPQYQVYQQQAQQQAPAAPAAGSDEGVGNVSQITVAGCSHATVGPIVRGDFTHAGDNHGKLVYKKDTQVNGLDVMIYFWDQRDGVAFCGWWFGPKVGGDQVWAYHPSQTSATPPKAGWKVPYDGPVDASFVITVRGQAPAPPQQSIAQYNQQQQAWQQQRNNHRQQNDDQRRQQEERAAQHRQQMEAMKAQQEEEKKKVQEEQRASLAIRSECQKLRVASPETFEAAKQAVEEALAKELGNVGAAAADKIKQECMQTIEQTTQRTLACLLPLAVGWVRHRVVMLHSHRFLSFEVRLVLQNK